jgi:ABC-2 type transport system permease protein
MPKVWLVAKREFLFNIKRRSFLFAAFGAPVLTVALMIVVFSVVGQSFSGDVTQPIGYVDLSGVLVDGIDRPDNFTAYPTEAAARAALEQTAVQAYFVVSADYLDSGEVTLYRGGDVPPSVEDAIDAYLLANLSDRLSDPVLARLAADPIDLAVRTLDNGRTIGDEGIIGVFLAPLIFVMIFMIATQTTSGYLMSSVVEEKTSRIMEILVTSLTPMQLLAGKIIGLGALGLVQLLVWVGAGAIILAFNQGATVLSGVNVPPDLLILAIIFFILEYFFYGSIMAGLGAATGSEQESRQIAGIFGFIFAIPFFALFTLFSDPDGTLSVILTLLPLTSPMWVIMRASFAAIPLWQIIASVAIMALTTVAVVWISARIFRWTLLMYGKRISLRTIGQALRPGARMQTTATGEAAG